MPTECVSKKNGEVPVCIHLKYFATVTCLINYSKLTTIKRRLKFDNFYREATFNIVTRQIYFLVMVAISTLGYIGSAICVVGWICRKMFSRSWGIHDETNEEDIRGKLVLITGANSGLGKEAAYEMARRGANVIMASRNLDLTKTAVEEIKRRLAGKSIPELIPMTLDLGSLESVRTFANDIRRQFDKIDILINNAGVAVPLKKQMKTADGYEYNLGVNHLGHFLLTDLVVDLVKKAAPSRIVIVASRLADRGIINFDDLMLEKENHLTSKVDPYGNSKLANLYFAKELSSRLEGTNVNVYALCPGWVKTDLFRYSDLKWGHYLIMIPVAFAFMRTPRQGVQTILHCALSSKVRQETGMFYRDCKHWTPKSAIPEDAAQKLWKVSESLVKL